MTDNQIIKVLSNLRKKFGRNVVTLSIKEKLRDRKRLIDDFFASEDLDFRDKDGEVFKTNLVYCKDTLDLSDFEKDWRGLEDKDYQAVVGVDNGKGKLIMTMNFVKKEESGQQFSSAGAKQGLVIA